MNLLITGAYHSYYEQLKTIEKMGHSVIFMQNESDSLPCAAERIEGVICNGLFLYHDIKLFKSLKFIQLTSAGFDRVPLDYINAHGIKIYNARGVYSVPMAEFAVSGVLQLYKKSRRFYENQVLRKWEKQRDLKELNGKTVLIIGCGSVGTECAKRFKAFCCKVFGIDINPYDNPVFSGIYSLDKLGDCLTGADVVVLTLPLDQKTKGLFDDQRFGQMKDGAVLINIARGGIVVENALIKALKTKLFGAVLDVYEKEPLDVNSDLWDMDNVILTPHNSFIGEGNDKRLSDLIISNMKTYYKR